MQVVDIMHKGITTVSPADSLKYVAAIMKRENIGSLPVFKEGRPVGFVTDRDIVVSCIANGASASDPVSKAMHQDIIFIQEDRDVAEAAKLMRDNQISRVLVVDRNKKPVGMVSVQNIVETATDDQLKLEVLTSIKRG